MEQPLLKPPNDLLAAQMGRKKELARTDAAVKAFTAAKDALATVTLLSYPVLNAITNLMTNAFDVAVGPVLQQFMDNEAPYRLFPRKLNRLRRDTVPSTGNC